MYQVHDEVELYGEVNNEENTGPAVLGVRWHHHIRETKRKREASNTYTSYKNCGVCLNTNVVRKKKQLS